MINYMGGKFRLSTKISDILNTYRLPNQLYYEPFIGGVSVFCKMAAPKIGLDIDHDLICTLAAIRDGWEPPTSVSEVLYNTYKAKRPKNDPLTGYIAFCTFGAKKWGGFARPAKDKRDKTLSGARRANKYRHTLYGAELECADFLDYKFKPGSLIYCDPPYNNTTSYTHKITQNHHADIWNRFNELSKDNVVIVSEYVSGHPNFIALAEFEHFNSIRKKIKAPCIERLFIHRDRIISK